jgi:hypothetical protein
MEFGRVDSRLWRRRESRRLRKHPGSPLSFAGTSGFDSIRLCFIISIMTDTTTPRSLFLPTARQTNALLIVAFLCVGEAMYLRYMVMENATMSLACQGGLATWLCDSFRLVNVLYPHQVFGWVALLVALLNLVRPSIVLVTVALAAASFGIVLHNADLSALAAGVLILSLARPAPTAE